MATVALMLDSIDVVKLLDFGFYQFAIYFIDMARRDRIHGPEY